jgi:hypothetical protein
MHETEIEQTPPERPDVDLRVKGEHQFRRMVGIAEVT